jgi:uncharacterized protein (DUF2267 family)
VKPRGVARHCRRHTPTQIGHDSLISFVQGAIGGDRERAELALRAVLQTIAERISAGEARQLAARLPPELAPWLNSDTRSEPFGVEEFLRRVAVREDASIEQAERDTRVVLAGLQLAVGPHELLDLASELRKDFAALLPRGPYVDVMPADEFVARVARRAGLDEAAAWRAVESVLETLAERIADGEVDDIAARLALELRAPLRRGRGRGALQRMSFEEFTRRVAEREGTSPSTARQHAGTVLATLREAVGDDEFFDVTVQLPSDFVDAIVGAA